MLTGQRRGEVGDLRWSEISEGKRQQIELPPPRCKNRRTMVRMGVHFHIVPLSDQALALLPERGEACEALFGCSTGGFRGWHLPKTQLDAGITKARGNPLPHWTLHDLRRSFVTHVSEYGYAPPHVVEAIINHLSGHKSGVVGVYAGGPSLPCSRSGSSSYCNVSGPSRNWTKAKCANWKRINADRGKLFENNPSRTSR